MQPNPELIAEAIQRKRDGFKYVLLPGGATGVECDAVLADAYLASHRGDDGTEITLRWLQDVGLYAGEHAKGPFLWDGNGYCWLRSEHDVYRIRLGEINTRGKMRMLCAGLGHELKENPAEQNEPREGREGK